MRRNEFWFITSPSGRLLCSICENIFSNNRRYDLNRHDKTQHETEIVGKLKLVFGFDLQKEYMMRKRKESKGDKIYFFKMWKLTKSYKIAFILAKSLFLHGEEIKQCL